jgi:hypothetical protein
VIVCNLWAAVVFPSLVFTRKHPVHSFLLRVVFYFPFFQWMILSSVVAERCAKGALSSRQIEANNGSYDMQLKNQDFKTQVERHVENSQLESVVHKSPLVNENVHTWPV